MRAHRMAARPLRYQIRLNTIATLSFLVIVWAVSIAQTQRTDQQALAPREIARATLPSVILVVMMNEKTVVYGSGFFVRPDVVATNFHVVQDTNKGYAKLVGEETRYEIVGVVGIDQLHDIVLLKLADHHSHPEQTPEGKKSDKGSVSKDDK